MTYPGRSLHGVGQARMNNIFLRGTLHNKMDINSCSKIDNWLFFFFFKSAAWDIFILSQQTLGLLSICGTKQELKAITYSNSGLEVSCRDNGDRSSLLAKLPL